MDTLVDMQSCSICESSVRGTGTEYPHQPPLHLPTLKCPYRYESRLYNHNNPPPITGQHLRVWYYRTGPILYIPYVALFLNCDHEWEVMSRDIDDEEEEDDYTCECKKCGDDKVTTPIVPL